MSNPRQMHLNIFLRAFGGHMGAGRLPGVNPYDTVDPDYHIRFAQRAEAARFDAIFTASASGFLEDIRRTTFFGLDTTALQSALAMVTRQIGLISTVSTTFTEPFVTARQLATLDHLSKGRAGWNIVTSSGDAEAQNFGQDRILAHELRYARAAEFLEVTQKLWDSWDADAFEKSAARGVIADPEFVREIHHAGEWFRVKGPAILPRPPQGRPLLVQAGSSSDGTAFAARNVDAVFTNQADLAGSRAFYAWIKAEAEGFGRDPASLKVLPGLIPIVAATEAEAREKKDQLDALIPRDYQLDVLRHSLGLNIDGLRDTDPLPPFPAVESVNSRKGRFLMLKQLLDTPGITLGEAIRQLNGLNHTAAVVGTPAQVADEMEHWFTTGAADGFNISAPSYPWGFEAICDLLIPELQRRGLFRRDYAESTLRARFAA
jgi:FMN-dependent oxidoreductase (nitrilotriacetate monooxygenase family)